MTVRLGQAVPDRQWSTIDAPVSEQFGLWQDAVDRAFVPVSLRRRGTGEFVSEVASRRLGPVAVTDLASPPQSVHRSGADVARATGDVFFLNLPMSDGAAVQQDGRTARLTPGDFTLLDSDRPFDQEFDQPFRQITLTLPREQLQRRLADPTGVTAVRIPGDRSIGAVASAAIRAASASAASMDLRSSRALAEQLVDLIALALGGVRPQLPSAPRQLLLQAALAQVERRLDDPALSPSAVATAVGVSTRYLHRLFADHGSSFGRWVLTRRLDRAYAEITDPDAPRRAVGDIALACGFADPSYFSRAFKERYDVSPRALRRLQPDVNP